MSSSKTNNNSDDIATLVGLGFSETQASQALQVSNGNLQAAANYLFTYPPPAAAPASMDLFTTSSNPKNNNNNHETTIIIEGTMSQYSVPDGRSACTCMALTAARLFLQDTTQPVKEAFLNSMIVEGVAVYQQIMMQQQTVGTGTEHLSAEQALPSFSTLQLLEGGIRQGLLQKNDVHHPLGLHQQLANCQIADAWVCVLLTKTPETVLVCLPPSSSSSSPAVAGATAASSTTDDHHYFLMDSHPRPPETNQASCRMHASFQDLCHSLERLFPVFEDAESSGNSELLLAMYNAFDLYPLIRKQDQQQQGEAS